METYVKVDPNEVLEFCEEMNAYANSYGVALECQGIITINSSWRESTGAQHPPSMVVRYHVHARNSDKQDYCHKYQVRQHFQDYVAFLLELEEQGELLKNTYSECSTASLRCYKHRGRYFLVSKVIGHGKIYWEEEISKALRLSANG